ncbi:epoxide hydrolase 4-like [Prunus yedoensis var. nudiflora]|uniref:Epoxide hydrolase 4-like n=1 Tax=Prunus yedoensis var. nudiflora TaxID=2094558 RepID=A0A314XSU4_PRUYE|nr:epoxide hydrolase 4-like [Prunus yedoensis var. nudiflora]
MKLVGVRPRTVDIEPGTIMNFWVSSNISSKIENTPKKSKPAVVFLHGFAMDGIFTWQLQVLSLAKNYAVYVPDFLFFGGSITDKSDRSLEFQAECVAKGLRKLGVERCTLVGFSFGGMVGSISDASLERLGFKCWPDYLLPDSVKGVRNMLEIAAYKFPYIPDWIYKDCFEVMFDNRKEREEFLEALVVDDKVLTIADFPQCTDPSTSLTQ